MSPLGILPGGGLFIFVNFSERCHIFTRIFHFEFSFDSGALLRFFIVELKNIVKVDKNLNLIGYGFGL